MFARDPTDTPDVTKTETYDVFDKQIECHDIVIDVAAVYMHEERRRRNTRNTANAPPARAVPMIMMIY